MSYTIRLRRVGDHHLSLPRRAHQSAGYDLTAVCDKVIYPSCVELVPTGFAWEIVPEGEALRNVTTFGLVRDRSGLATKTGLVVVAGVVDGDYRGEVMVALRNCGDEPVQVRKGDRIAQMLLLTGLTPALQEVVELDDTRRGMGAMGSTGIAEWFDTSTKDNYA